MFVRARMTRRAPDDNIYVTTITVQQLHSCLRNQRTNHFFLLISHYVDYTRVEYCVLFTVMKLGVE